nr:hypothetical protein [uncultured Methanoregula sp.]
MSGKMLAPVLGILIFFSSSLWLIMRNTVHSIPFNINIPESKKRVKFWAICYFLLYTLSILAFQFRINLYERPLIYFIFLALMSGVIACEILSAERRYTSLILIQIIFLGMNVYWTQSLIAPGLIGIDPWYHEIFTGKIINDNFILKDQMYSNLPIFHLIIAVTSIVTALPYKFSAIFSVCFLQIACDAIFIFLIVKHFFKNIHFGLLSALLIIILDLHIRMTYWSIPSGFGFVFIAIALYLIFTRIKNTYKIILVSLLILMMILIILTHALIATCMAFFLFTIWGSIKLYQYLHSKSESNISLLVPIIFTTVMIGWWIYLTWNFSILTRFLYFDYSLTMPSISTVSLAIPFGEMVFSSIGHNLFFTVAIFGILYMISKKGNSSTFSLALISVIPLIIVFIADIIGSEILSNRWSYISYTLLSIPLALTIYSISNWAIKKEIYVNIFNFGFVAALSFLMLMSPYGNVDNNTFYPNTNNQNFYLQSEITGSNFFSQNSIGFISTDIFNSHTYFIDETGNIQNRIQSLETELNTGNFNQGGITVIRTRFLSTATKKKGFLAKTIIPNVDIYLSNLGFNKIYENSGITGYSG